MDPGLEVEGTWWAAAMRDKKQWGLGQREQMPEILKRQGFVIGWWGSSKR